MLILRLKRCERALAGGRLDEAAELLAPADARAHRRGQELLNRLVAALVMRGADHLADGRLGPADADCHAAARLAGNTLEVARLRAAVDRGAEERRRTSEEQRQARSAVQRPIRQGPFALAGEVAGAAAAAAVVFDPGLRPGPSPRRFLLHVDGSGSFVVLQGDRIDVGRHSVSQRADLPLITAAGWPALTLLRCDEDYFLSATAPVAVNDRVVPNKLLASGDRIAVGPRGRIEFRRPNAASGTVVLRMGGVRLPWGGVRDVLWMDREIVMGASAAAHVRVHPCPAPVILQASGDGLLCRADETIVIDGRRSGRTANVIDGARVCVGCLSFVVCRE